MLEEGIAKACCADLYQSDLATFILGDTLHPGGLALTNRLAKLMSIQAGDWVADLACGRGTSALAISRVFHCRVVGIDFGQAAVANGVKDGQGSPGATRAYFLKGDAEAPPLRSGCFDAAYSECSMSLFPNKSRALLQAVDILRPGGKFGLSDVTVEANSLPRELNGPLGQILCLTGALDPQGYNNLLGDAGLRVRHQVDASLEILRILDNIESKLVGLRAWQSIAAQSPVELLPLAQAPGLLDRVRKLVQGGQIGYWLYVAEKPMGAQL